MTDRAADALGRTIRGEVATPGEAAYDEGRTVWNARFDRNPGEVVRCRTADDVRATVDFVRDHRIPFAVKAGGHSNAGHSAIEGGVLIDLSLMKGVEIDPAGRTAKVEAGVTWGEFDAAAQRHGLATTGGTVSTVGVSGFTLGGGTGYLVRRHGMAIDNLRSVELVTAEGRLVRASEGSHPDLFWAVRGGGGNFGIATLFEFRMHEVGPEVLAGQVMHTLDAAPELLRRYRDVMAGAPEEMQCYAFFLRVPPIDAFPEAYHGQVALDFVLFHADPGAAGRAAVEPLVEAGSPFLSAVAPQPYAVVQQSFDAGLPEGQRYDSRAHYLDRLTDAAIDTIVEHVAGLTGPLSVAYLEPLGGAAGRVDPAATAYPHRSAAYSFHLMPGWMDPGEDGDAVAWVERFHAAMAPHATGGVYVNLLGPGEENRIRAAYGSNHARLLELKRTWDPDNLFRRNPNLVPGG